MKNVLNFIDGQLRPPHNHQYFTNFSPANGTPLGSIPDSDHLDIESAVLCAHKAFAEWSKTPTRIRSNILRKIGDLILKNSDSLAMDESLDTGRPITLAKTVDIPRSALNFHFFSEAVTQFSSESHPMDQMAINYTARKPLGVVAAISPWNLPLYLLTWKIAPALAVGNCVVAKPSELSPLTAHRLSEICQQAGLPPGVLNIVHGLGNKAGEALINHPGIAAVSFTGGTRTGIHIARQLAPTLKKLSLELGGKNPAVIFADCDFDTAVETTVRSSFTNQGQICLCGPRILVEKGLYPRFKQALVEKTKQLKLGHPDLPETQVGAVISQNHMEKILSYIEVAKSEGGTFLTGGERKFLTGEGKEGWYISPTIIEGISPQSKVNQEEIFGPVVTLLPFESEEEALTLANGTPYGLSATLWTQNLKRAHTFSEKLECGMVWVNCWMLRDLRTPFAGVKQSGLGSEGGQESLRFFTEAKNICIRYT